MQQNQPDFSRLCEKYQQNSRNFLENAEKFVELHAETAAKHAEMLKKSALLYENSRTSTNFAELSVNLKKLQQTLEQVAEKLRVSEKKARFYEKLTNIVLDFEENTATFRVDARKDASLLENPQKMRESLKNLSISQEKAAKRWEMISPSCRNREIRGFYGDFLRSFSEN